MSFTLETGILALSGVFLTPSPNASPVGIIMTKLGEVLIAWIRPVSQKHHEEVYCEYRFPNGRDNGFEGGFGEPIMNVSALYRDRTYRNFESNYEELSGVFGLMDEQRIKVILLIKFKICMKTEYTKLYGEISPGIEEEIYNYCDDIYRYLGGGGGKRRKTKKRNPNL